MGQPTYIYIWEYRVRQGAETEFETLYGPGGRWVELFRKAEGYWGTVLHRDLENPGRYLTIDTWESEAAYTSFRRRFSKEFEEIDRTGEALTQSESRIGAFCCLG